LGRACAASRARGGTHMSKRLHSSAWGRLRSPSPVLPPAGNASGATVTQGGLEAAAAQRHAWQIASVWMLGLWGVGALANEAVASLGLAGCALLVGFDLVCSSQSVELLWHGVTRWWPLLAWTAWAIASPLLAGRTPSGTGVARVADWLALPCAAYLWGRLPDPSRVRLGLTWAAVFVVSCVCAGLQSFGLWPTPALFEHVSWLHVPFSRVYEPASAPGRFMGGGLLFHRLKFAHVGGLAVLAATLVALSAHGRIRAAAFAVAAVGVFSIGAFSFARTALVALAVSLAAALLIALPRRRALALSLGMFALVLAALVATPSLRARFGSTLGDEGSGARTALWETGLRAVQAHPLLGVGAGRFRPGLFSTEGTPPAVRSNAGKSHNQFLSLAAEEGLPGLALFVLWLAMLGRHFWSAEHPQPLGMSALLFFILLSGLHDPLFQACFSMGLVLVLGLAWSDRRGRMWP